MKIEATDKQTMNVVDLYKEEGIVVSSESDTNHSDTSDMYEYKRNRIENAEDVINVEAQMKSHRTHRSSLDTDTGFINAEADACVLLDEEDSE